MPSHPCVLENYFIANTIHGSRAIFLNICGHDTYCLDCDLFLRAPEEVSLSEILQVLLDHLYMPEKSVILERFRFNQWKQCDEESVMVYIAELQKLSINCTFGNTLYDMLRDRLVCGLSSPKIQKLLLDYKKLTLAQARDIEVSMELPEENAKLISDSPGKSNMLKLKDTHIEFSYFRCRRKHLVS